jgi:N6-adenosine-specific RNA methylase IME4
MLTTDAILDVYENEQNACTPYESKKYYDFNDVPKHKYKTLLCDPDWQFKTFSEKGKGKSPDRHYKDGKSTPTDGIKAQPIKDMIHPDGAVLFLWCTWPTIFDAKEVMEAWGFQYSGLAWEWIKRNPTTQKYAFGGGYGTRKNLEPCLMGRTKNFNLVNNIKNRKTRDMLFAPKREHSRKPDEQYKLIEDMFDGPRIELYARQQWPNWDAAGYEVDRFEAVSPAPPLMFP